MLNYDALSKKPLIFKSFTGLEVPEFDAIYTKIRETHTAYEQKRLYREDRKRKSGAGHPFKLPLKDRLAMLLMYYRLYVTSTLPAFHFDPGQTNVLKDTRMLEPLDTEALPLPSKLHQRAGRLGTLDEVEALFPGSKPSSTPQNRRSRDPRLRARGERITPARRRGTRSRPR